MVIFHHGDEGTTEKTWMAAHRPHRLGPISVDTLQRLVVVSAHPDDESLGVGGLIAHVDRLGLPIVVIVLSSGEASHPQSSTHSPARLAQIRRREVTDALALLAPSATVHLLELPDGYLVEHTDAAEEAISSAIGVVGDGTWIVAPWREDGHPDHRAASTAAQRAAHTWQARLLEYPIWAWHWSNPDDPIWQEGTVRSFELSSAERKNKAQALALHQSQVGALSELPGDEAIVPASFRAHFARPYETFIEQPGRQSVDQAADPPVQMAQNYQKSAGTSPNTLSAEYFGNFYASGEDPWGFETRWYEKRKRAVLMAALPRQGFARALELGCSNGVLTAELAPYCNTLLAIDVVDQPLVRARARLAEHPGVSFERRTLPDEWPDGQFDLIVLSEVGYYFSIPDLRRLLERARASLAPDGVLVACHWRHLVPDYPLTGDAVHTCLSHVVGLARTVHHLERDFVLDVYEHRPAQSVAQRDGLVP